MANNKKKSVFLTVILPILIVALLIFLGVFGYFRGWYEAVPGAIISSDSATLDFCSTKEECLSVLDEAGATKTSKFLSDNNLDILCSKNKCKVVQI